MKIWSLFVGKRNKNRAHLTAHGKPKKKDSSENQYHSPVNKVVKKMSGSSTPPELDNTNPSSLKDIQSLRQANSNLKQLLTCQSNIINRLVKTLDANGLSDYLDSSPSATILITSIFWRSDRTVPQSFGWDQVLIQSKFQSIESHVQQ